MLRHIVTTLYVAAVMALPLGLAATPALADPDQTVTVLCSTVFGPSAAGTITIKQNDDKIAASLHCNTDLPGPNHAMRFKCDTFAPDVKGQFVFTPSGNIEGHCSFPQ